MSDNIKRSEYLGKLPRFDDHVGAVPGSRFLTCRAVAPGATGDCTRAVGHKGHHQNGATRESFTNIESMADNLATLIRTAMLAESEAGYRRGRMTAGAGAWETGSDDDAADAYMVAQQAVDVTKRAMWRAFYELIGQGE